MNDFKDWVKATEITETENGVYMKVEDSEIFGVLVEDYGAEKIGECELVLSVEEFYVLKEVYENSLIDWS